MNCAETFISLTFVCEVSWEAEYEPLNLDSEWRMVIIREKLEEQVAQISDNMGS